jgi:hypothetical protein
MLEPVQATRVSLSEADFAVLVRGGVVDRDGVQVALQDIGWERMYFQIERALRDTDGTGL